MGKVLPPESKETHQPLRFLLCGRRCKGQQLDFHRGTPKNLLKGQVLNLHEVSLPPSRLHVNYQSQLCANPPANSA